MGQAGNRVAVGDFWECSIGDPDVLAIEEVVVEVTVEFMKLRNTHVA